MTPPCFIPADIQCQQEIFCCRDLDLDPITLTYQYGLDTSILHSCPTQILHNVTLTDTFIVKLDVLLCRTLRSLRSVAELSWLADNDMSAVDGGWAVGISGKEPRTRETHTSLTQYSCSMACTAVTPLCNVGLLPTKTCVMPYAMQWGTCA